ncbi:hypothetical protein [Pseudarthrobacter sp. N5]|uniref:hypothetical protein n=1 Tax=Pseudarthrobacter sp. N5 TaxID=3418416 RepID=UPI003CF690D9
MSEEELEFQKDMKSKTPLNDHVKQNTLRFITGQRPLSEFGPTLRNWTARAGPST